IILDQLTEADTGVVTSRVRDGLAAIGQAYPDLILFADSREWITLFRNIIIKCNQGEAFKALGGELPIGEAAAKMRAITGRPAFITLGKDGIAAGEDTIIPAAVQTGPIDVCGAGDATTAAIVCGLCAGATMAEAALLGNLAAGVTLRKLGTTGTASPGEMIALYHEQFEADE
ncbi:MAG: carbohydrate kinase, partial [Firmicutes bacterium]|nr:carbohydrate kinase [Bacillota bacterium]